MTFRTATLSAIALVAAALLPVATLASPPDAAGAASEAPRPVVTTELPTASLDYYLGAESIPGEDRDPAITPPSATLGWEVGTWHVRHDQLVAVHRRLAAESDRVVIEEIGRTHEQRPLVQLTISSPRNLGRLDAIRSRHAELSDPRGPRPSLDDLPVVVNLGYSIHGNEPSGSNASMLVAYHLASARGEAIDRLLDQLVIVLDPSLNPDGLSRFAQWTNMHRGRTPVADARHREHVEGWPNGRTNHYWFDLNRDWLLAQHPESQARLASFHRWRPNVLTDFHEMGTRSTYFFQPGVPSRKNPLTPDRNVELTRRFAEEHARALDTIGSLYFTEELFDDFYYGKGSTYPDLQGSVGILFEQASSRGHVQESPNGPVAFPFTIRNQVLTSFSTLAAAQAQRQELLDYRADFFERSLELADEDSLVGWVFDDDGDPARAHRFLELMWRHQVEVHRLAKNLDFGGRTFEATSSWIVPHDQPQYRLVRSLFERRVDFPDSTFYDVSTWTAPLAFGLPHTALPRARDGASWIGERIAAPTFPSAAPPPGILGDGEAPEAEAGVGKDGIYAWAFRWDSYYAPRALQRLLAAGVKARVATKSFTLSGHRGEEHFDRGSILVPTSLQTVQNGELDTLWRTIAEQDGVRVHAFSGGLTPKGIDLGSPSLRPVELPRVALMVGRGVSTYAAGEIWHLLDHHFAVALPLLDLEDLRPRDLAPYTHLVLADGDYDRLPGTVLEALRPWVRNGGVLVTLQRASRWAEHQVLRPNAANAGQGGAPPPALAAKPPNDSEKTERRSYADLQKDRAERLISGAIFAIDLDLGHPLAYGYRGRRLPVFRNHKVFLEPVNDPYVHVAVYTGDPLLSGFVSADNLDRLRNAPAVIARRHGRGVVVQMADDPNFRAFWHATHKLFLNSLYFGPILEDTRSPSGR